MKKQEESIFEALTEEGVSIDTIYKNILNAINQPPTVRPMSDLPEEGMRVLFLVKYRVQGQEFTTGKLKKGLNSDVIELDSRYWHYKQDDFICMNTQKQIIGWLPLPNPNDIKL